MASARAFYALTLSLVCLAQPLAQTAVADSGQLSAIREKVRQSFPAVPQLAPDDFVALQSKASAPLVILDVREPDEFAVSHIEGARRVDPKITAGDFQKAFGGEIKGATVVLYCSVGMRSSNLATQIAETSKQSGATAVYNLDGGVFRWHNEKRPLVRGANPTDEVHGYDYFWSRHLQRQDRVTTD